MGRGLVPTLCGRRRSLRGWRDGGPGGVLPPLPRNGTGASPSARREPESSSKG